MVTGNQTFSRPHGTNRLLTAPDYILGDALCTLFGGIKRSYTPRMFEDLNSLDLFTTIPRSRKLRASSSTTVTAQESGHDIALEAPGKVVEAVRQVVEMVKEHERS